MISIFALATIGLTLLLVEGSIFEFLRRMFPAFNCYQCTGFWSGLTVAFFTFSYDPVAMLLGGFAGSFLAILAGLLLDLLEALIFTLAGEQSETRNS